MKKMGLICLVLVIAIGSMGISYATWSQALTTNGNVSTGTFSAIFQQVAGNDPSTLADPKEAGMWTLSSNHPAWNGGQATFNNASTAVSGAGSDTMTMTMTGTYPGYWSSAGCTIKNTGSIPLKVQSVTVAGSAVTPPTGRTTSDVTVSYSGVLDESTHTPINPKEEKIGGIYIKWNAVPSTQSTYTVTVNITVVQGY